MKENTHLQAIPEDVLTQAQTKISEVLTLLNPYLLALTPAERQGMPKMGEKTIGFVEKAYDFAKQNPNLVPPYLEIAAFGTDFSDAHGLWTLGKPVSPVCLGVFALQKLHKMMRRYGNGGGKRSLPSRLRVLQVCQNGGGGANEVGTTSPAQRQSTRN